MKVSRKQAARNHERILDVAADLFRERGFEAVGVAELMSAAGLTHGGFYGHFASKEDLIAQACGRTVARSLERWAGRANVARELQLPSIVRAYLSTSHRDNPANGCIWATLGADVARQSASVRHAVTEGLRSSFVFLVGLIPGKSRAARRRKAISTYATLVGAMVMARAVDDAALSKEILNAALATIGENA